jgi:membrane dipeptidase
MEEQVGRSGNRFEMAGSNEELDNVLTAGRTAIVHTVEDGRVLGAGLGEDDLDGRLARVDELATRGVASITLAHLFPNELAGHTEGIPEKQRKARLCPLHTEVDLTRGLTATGEAVVKRMVEKRMIPDVTHCTPAARARVYELVANEIPVIASHNGVRSMNDVPYNLDEGDVTAIAASRGVVGVIFMPYWLDRANPGKGLDAIWRTMEAIHDLSGGSWDNVAIGTDFDGFTDPPDDCKNASKLPLIQELLDGKGVSRDDAEAILGGNARRVLSLGWS